MDVDLSGNLYLTGDYGVSFDCDPGSGTSTLNSVPVGSDECWLVKLDENGALVWGKSMGGTGTQEGWNVRTTGPGCLVLSGYYSDDTLDVDGGPGLDMLPKPGNSNFFVVKYCPCDIIESNDTTCEGESVNFYGQNAQYEGWYIETYTSSEGCDSVMAMNLHVNKINKTIIETSGTLMATQADAQYQWLDCNNNYEIIPGAISQSFTPSVAGNYSVEIRLMDCIDTTNCYNFQTVGTNAEFASEFLIFPNPANDEITIRWNQWSVGLTVRLFSPNGVQVMEIQLQNEDFNRVSLGHLPAGVYFLHLESQNQKAVERVVIMR